VGLPDEGLGKAKPSSESRAEAAEWVERSREAQQTSPSAISEGLPPAAKTVSLKVRQSEQGVVRVEEGGAKGEGASTHSSSEEGIEVELW
jgi:phage protein D